MQYRTRHLEALRPTSYNGETHAPKDRFYVSSEPDFEYLTRKRRRGALAKEVSGTDTDDGALKVSTQAGPFAGSTQEVQPTASTPVPPEAGAPAPASTPAAADVASVSTADAPVHQAAGGSATAAAPAPATAAAAAAPAPATAAAAVQADAAGGTTPTRRQPRTARATGNASQG